ncbi:hypothetical protein P9847_01335 [Paenibacillus chibensis]|uniref:Uncharacterized protein n=1 Tax=Paenibacillus chibensis TaxID=59846 RepID=A0ABU6PP40_9BACL|nr:hypothetical protein [Paenibacillus chibensis]
MAWTKEQKDLQRKSFERWKAKNVMNHKSGFLPRQAADSRNSKAAMLKRVASFQR